MILQIIQNGQVVDTRDLAEGSLKIGRSKDCDICLTSSRVSKAHGLFVVKDGKAAVIDTGSSNGIFVNGVLVKKQRLHFGDEITIADYTLRFLREAPSAHAPDEAHAFDGNAALKMDTAPVSDAKPAALQREQILQLVDQRVLIPLYALMKTVDWRWILGTILAAALALSVAFSVIPVVRWGQDITTKEALARGHTVLVQTVRENFRLMTKAGETALLTVESCENERGVLSCYIVEAKNGGVLAPTRLLSKTVLDEYSLVAIERLKAGEENVSVHARGSAWVLAEPIYLVRPDTGERELSAVAIASFQADTGSTSTFTPLAEAGLFVAVFALAAFFLILKMVQHPLTLMREQLDAALKGDSVSVDPQAKFQELEDLAQTMNFSISRIAQGGPAAPVSLGEQGEAEDAAFLKTVEEFDQGMGDGVLVLDLEKKVSFVGKVLEELISLRNQYARGQNISDACKDPSFAGTVIDLADRVVNSLGETQEAQLEVNGVQRSLAAVAHRNSVSEIRFVILTLKMSEG